jgi:hypothetical protein
MVRWGGEPHKARTMTTMLRATIARADFGSVPVLWRGAHCNMSNGLDEGRSSS